VIRFQQVSKRYAAGPAALDSLSFSLRAGEMAFVTGHSGAGKSTLLKLIGLLERPTRGMVSVAGHNLARVRRGGIARLRRNVGMVFQDPYLLADHTVAENVELPLVAAGRSISERGKRVRAALGKVGLDASQRKYPRQLSAGERQRVGIARAIAGRPTVLIADEPTGNLDPQLTAEIMQLFIDLQSYGVTVLVASHDLLQVKRMRRRVLVLDHGRLVDDVPADEVAP